MQTAIRTGIQQDRAPHPLVGAATRFSLHTLMDADMILADLVGRWIQGDDQIDSIRRMACDLHDDVELLLVDCHRDDVLDRATTTLRSLSAAYRRDEGYGLVRIEGDAPSALRAPDHFDAMARLEVG